MPAQNSSIYYGAWGNTGYLDPARPPGGADFGGPLPPGDGVPTALPPPAPLQPVPSASQLSAAAVSGAAASGGPAGAAPARVNSLPPGADAELAKKSAADRGDAPRAKTKLLWAEGLRGVAAAIVVNQHFVTSFATEMNNGYGPGPAEDFDGGQDHGSVVAWLCWPFLRVIYNGTFTVYVFFVLSGFVLSYRYLSLVRDSILQQSPQGLAHAERTVGSTMLRRFPRLFIPCLAIVLISYMILALGGYDRTQEVAEIAGGNPEAWFYRVAPNRETSSEFLRLFRQTWVTMWINKVNDLDSSMWTMAYELTGSVYAFMAALVIGRAAGLRFPPGLNYGGPHWMMLAAAFWCMSPGIYATYAYYSCFFFGIAIAWLDLDPGAMPWRASIRMKFPLDDQRPAWKQGNTYVQEIFPTCMFILSLWLASFPMRGSSVAWAEPLRVVAQFFYNPEDPEELVKMWYPLGAALMTWAIVESRWLRACFGNAVGVFLGQISFMSYLIHGPLVGGGRTRSRAGL
ncbi:acyltransferase family-domain-containing protein [Hyaloraphidium curvatum]|nr:acyltransferase family-domain-containing protein [Hyaloraphidium curvatum]